MTLGFMLTLIGQAIAGGIWQFDLLNPEAQYDVMDPDYAMAQRVVMLFSHAGMFILSALLAAHLFGRRGIKAELMLGSKPIYLTYLIIPVLMAFLFPVINYLYELNLRWNAPPEVIEMEKATMRLQDAFLNVSQLDMLLLNLLVIALVPAIGEEFIFRGLLQRYAIEWLKNPHLGIWFSACIFSFMHFQFMGFLPRFALGAFFGYVVLWTGSLWAGIFLHFLNNGLAILLSWLTLNDSLDERWNDLGANDPKAAAIGAVGAGAISWVIFQLNRKKGRSSDLPL